MGIADDYTRFTLRIPELLHKALLRRARHNKRSLNGEIISILEQQKSVSESDHPIYHSTDESWESKFEQLPVDQKRAVRLLINALLKV